MGNASVAEQIDRLAAVDLSKQEARKARRSSQRVRPKMLPMVDRRLQEWAQWWASEGCARGGVSGQSPLYALMKNKGEVIRGSGTVDGSMPDDIYDMDRVVNRLDDPDRRVVSLQYVHLDLTPDQRAAELSLGRRAFYERVAKVHQKIFFMLKTK